MEQYKFLEHTADVKFKAFGQSVEEVFANCVLALKESIAEKIKIKSIMKKKIKIGANDIEGLLYAFLEEFLYLLDAEDFLIGDIKDIEIDLTNFSLVVVAVGDKASNYKFTNDVKAVTYNDMFVKKGKEGWVAQVVLDV